MKLFYLLWNSLLIWQFDIQCSASEVDSTINKRNSNSHLIGTILTSSSSINSDNVFTLDPSYNYASINNAPIAWYQVKFSHRVYIHALMFFSTTSFNGPITLAYRYSSEREFTVYKEQGTIKEFDKNALPHIWEVYELKRPFMANEVRIHVGYDLPGRNIKLRFYSWYAVKSFVTAGIGDAVQSTDDHIEVLLEQPSIISSFIIYNGEELESFCIRYESVNGDEKSYKDQVTINGLTVFHPSLNTASVRPFLANKVIFTCFKTKYIKPLYSIAVTLFGKKASEPEHYWSAAVVEQRDDLIFYFKDLSGDTPMIYGNINAMTKKGVSEYLMSNAFGAECYTRPDYCNDGFSVEFTTKDALSQLEYQYPSQGYTRYYGYNPNLHDSGTIEIHFDSQRRVFGLKLYKTTLFAYSKILRFKLQFPALSQNGDSFSAKIYLMAISKLQDVTTEAFYEEFMNKISNDELPFVSHYFKADMGYSNNIDLAESCQTLLDSTFAPRLMVFIMTEISNENVQRLQFISEDIVVDLALRGRVYSHDTHLSSYTKTAEYNINIHFDSVTCITRIKFMTFESSAFNSMVITPFVIFPPNYQEKIFIADGTTEINLVNQGDEKMVWLYMTYCLTHMRMTTPDNSYQNLKFALYGLTGEELKQQPEVFPLVSAGLLANDESSSGTGFSIFYNKEAMFFVVQTSNKKYIIKQTVRNSASTKFTMTWNKSGLKLYTNNTLISTNVGISSDGSPIASQEYLMLLHSYHSSFSYTKASLHYLKLFKQALNVEEQQTEEMEFNVENEAIFNGFSLAPDCVSMNLIPACEVENDATSYSIEIQSEYFILETNDESPSTRRVPKFSDDSNDAVIVFPLKLQMDTMHVVNVKVKIKLTEALAQGCNSSKFAVGINNHEPKYGSDRTCKDIKENTYVFNIYPAFLEAVQTVSEKPTKLIFRLVSSLSTSQLIQDGIANLEFIYNKAEVFLFADAILKSMEDLYNVLDVRVDTKMLCLKCELKFAGSGYTRVMVHGYSNLLYGKLISTYYRSNYIVGTWSSIEVPLSKFQKVKFVAVKSLSNEGYIGLKSFYFNYASCRNAIESNHPVSVEETVKVLEKVGFPVFDAYLRDTAELPITPQTRFTMTTSCSRNMNNTCEPAQLKLFLNGFPYNEHDSLTFNFNGQTDFHTLTLSFWCLAIDFTYCVTVHTHGYYLAVHWHLSALSLSQNSQMYAIHFDGGNIQFNEWHHFVMQCNDSTNKWTVYIDLKPVTYWLNCYHYLTQLAFGKNIVNFQLYLQPLTAMQIRQTVLFPIEFSESACPQSTNCSQCDQIDGENFYSSYIVRFKDPFCSREKIFKRRNIPNLLMCLDLSMSRFTSYYTLDSETHLTDVNGINGIVLGTTAIYPYAVVNKGLCFLNSEKIVLVDSMQLCGECYFGVWLKHHCNKKNLNEILIGTEFIIKCNNDDESNQEYPVGVTIKNNNWLVPGRSGLWYHIALNVASNDIYVNGIKVESETSSWNQSASCLASLCLGKSKMPISMDEMYIGENLKITELFDHQLYGEVKSLNNAREMFAQVLIEMFVDIPYTTEFDPHELQTIKKNIQQQVKNLKIDCQYEQKKFQQISSGTSITVGIYVRQVTDDILEKLKLHKSVYEPMNIAVKSSYVINKMENRVVSLRWIEHEHEHNGSVIGHSVMGLGIQIKDSHGEIAYENKDVLNADNIIIPDLIPFSTFVPCFACYTAREKLQNSFHCLENSFKTPESTPISGPQITCSAQTNVNVCKMICQFSAIDASSWHGVPYDYKLYWKQSSNRPKNLNQKMFNLTSYTLINVTYFEGGQNYEVDFNADFSYTQYCVIGYASTMNGTGYGVRTSTCARSCEGAPEAVPNGLIISQENLEVVLKWNSLTDDVDIWNIEDISRSFYRIQSGKILGMISFSNKSIKLNETSIEIMTTSELVYKIDSVAGDGNVMWYFSLAAVSVAAGNETEFNCKLLNLEVPSITPIILQTLSNTSSTIHILIEKVNMLKWRGELKYFKMLINSTDMVVPNAFQKIRIKRLTETHEIESYVESKPCNKSQILQYLSENNKNFDLTWSDFAPFSLYNFTIFFCNEVGCGAPSRKVSVQTREGVPTCGPNVSLIANSTTKMYFVWTMPPMSCTYGDVLSFSVSLNAVRLNQTTLFSFESWNSHFVFERLDYFGNYCVAINVVTMAGSGPLITICNRTMPYRPFLQPNVSGISTSNSSAIVRLSSPTDSHKLNGLLTGVNAYCLPINIINPVPVNVTFPIDHDDFLLNGANITIVVLQPFTQYFVIFCYQNDVGIGNMTGMLNFTTKEGVPSHPPANITTDSFSVTSVQVHVKDIPELFRNGIIISYIICYTTTIDKITSSEEQCRNFPISNISHYTIDELHRDDILSIRVAGMTNTGIGPFTDPVFAETMSYVNGNWSEWSNWRHCSKSCGVGYNLRKRVCSNPPPSIGGSNCTGSSRSTRPCMLMTCPVIAVTNEGEVDCKRTCATNDFRCSQFTQMRNFDLKLVNCTKSISISDEKWAKEYHPIIHVKSNECRGYIQIPPHTSCESSVPLPPGFARVCNCVNKFDEGYLEWGSWSPCTTTCDESERKRMRKCAVGSCIGNAEQLETCNVPLCPVDGGWGSWSDFSECNKTCGSGFQNRTRECVNPPRLQVGDEGLDCPGPAMDFRGKCNTDICPQHGKPGEWDEWSNCSRPCGNDSFMYRRRHCDNPKPKYRGKFCEEHLIEKKPCLDLQPCSSVDIHYTISFSQWIWNWRYYNKEAPECVAVMKNATEIIEEALSQFPHIKTIGVTDLTKGSIVVHYKVMYSSIHDQSVIEFVDSIYENRNLLGHPVSVVHVYSHAIACTPITHINVLPHDITSVNVSWSPSVCNDTRVIWNYMFYIEDKSINAEWNTRSIPDTLSWAVVRDLKPSTMYRAYLQPAVDYGNGVPSDLFYINVPGLAPDGEPMNVHSVSTASTRVYVSWDAIPPNKTNGDLSGYKIYYKPYFASTFKVTNVGRQFHYVTLKDLKPFTFYRIEVTGFNSAGEGPPEYSLVETLEGVPSILVPDIEITDMQSIDWWAISWGRISDEYSNGVLLGYRLIYYKSYRSDVEVGGEKELVDYLFDNNTFFFKAKGMVNYAVYNVSVMGFTAAGDGPSIEYVARTCRCKEELYANWYRKEPFTVILEDDSLGGLFPGLLQRMVKAACGECKRYTHSSLNFNVSRTGEPNDKETEHGLRKSISSLADFSFPIYAGNMQQIAPKSLFVPLIPSPGCIFLVRTKSDMTVVLEKMIFNLLKVWPLLVVSYLIATIFGFAVWFLDQFTNPDEFTLGSSLKGPAIGFWFSFVTMTTIGYGDLTPRSVAAKCFAMAWFLVGLILNGIIVGFIITALTTLNEVQSDTLYNTKTAALNNSFAYRFAVLRNADINSNVQYTSVESMLEALESRLVDVVFLDVFQSLPYNSLIKEKGFRISSFIDTKSSYGFVVSGMSKALETDIFGAVKEVEPEIAVFVEGLKQEMPDFIPATLNGATADIFSSKSPGFRLALTYLCYSILVCSILGIFFDIGRRCRKKKVQPKDQPIEIVQELTTDLLVFFTRFNADMEEKTRTYDKERVELFRMKEAYNTKVKHLGRMAVDYQIAESFGKVAGKKKEFTSN